MTEIKSFNVLFNKDRFGGYEVSAEVNNKMHFLGFASNRGTGKGYNFSTLSSVHFSKFFQQAKDLEYYGDPGLTAAEVKQRAYMLAGLFMAEYATKDN